MVAIGLQSQEISQCVTRAADEEKDVGAGDQVRTNIRTNKLVDKQTDRRSDGQTNG